MSKGTPKPSLSLIPASKIAVDSMAMLYRKLTGREPTPEEFAAAEAILTKAGFGREAADPPPAN